MELITGNADGWLAGTLNSPPAYEGGCDVCCWWATNCHRPRCQQCNTVESERETRDDPELNWVKLCPTCVKDCDTSIPPTDPVPLSADSNVEKNQPKSMVSFSYSSVPQLVLTTSRYIQVSKYFPKVVVAV